jgi:hypothetical protein
MKLLKAGIASAAMIAMMLITTRSSMSVNPRRSIEREIGVVIIGLRFEWAAGCCV